ncbi:hypothetical protein KFL_002540230 [Klebsormidium nitens]|uniref:Uncharacterized protein n=1 Tax=Klebsormidium nitens TaxID=105231 RepID=A0A1Y1I8Q7_KLENI|nr:hypothetical protein KFL_002540230 [Klebsormidium nitens]|eukprot:GAQ85789.1 hypothetical protein KFL_002540230 [Klebsormidium nitens]
MGALAESIKGIRGGIRGELAVTSCNISSATTPRKHGPPPVSFHRAPFQPSLQKGAVCFSSPCNAQGLDATTALYAATTTSIVDKNGPSLQIVSRAEQSLNKVTASARAYDPVDTRDRAAAAAFESRASNAVNLLSDARQAADAGRWSEALQTYSKIVAEYSDLALAAYARVGRALALYEVGDKGEAILELQDMSLELKGSPEVHAALAATLYHDKKQFAQAENQFAAATILDPRYNDLEWVQKQKVWPPSLVQALSSFLLLN